MDIETELTPEQEHMRYLPRFYSGDLTDFN